MRTVWLHLVLALSGLILAYLTWTSETSSGSAEVVTIADCSPQQVRAVTYVSEARENEFRIEEDRWWARTNREAQTEESPPRRFLLSEESATSFIDRFAPLVGNRDLGAVGEDEEEDLGLHEPTATFTVRCGEQERSYEVGGSAFGSGDRYVRSAEGGSVYLVDSATLGELRAPESMMQRELTTLSMPDVYHAEVTAYGRSLRLQQINRLVETQAEWVDAEDPTRRNELYTNWMSALRRVRIHQYLDAGQEPGQEDQGVVNRIPVARITFQAEDDGVLETVELLRVDAEGEASSQYYARSEATVMWAKLLRASAGQVEQDLRSVMGLEVEAETPSDDEVTSDAESPARPAADASVDASMRD